MAINGHIQDSDGQKSSIIKFSRHAPKVYKSSSNSDNVDGVYEASILTHANLVKRSKLSQKMREKIKQKCKYFLRQSLRATEKLKQHGASGLQGVWGVPGRK